MWIEWTVGAGLTAWLTPKAVRRAQLSRAKHRSLAGHSRMAKRLAKLLREYHYSEAQFFAADGAPDEVQTQRRQGLTALSQSFMQSPQTIALSRQAREQISDMQLTGRNRVPFQFSPVIQQYLSIGSFWQSSSGIRLKDLDNREFIDLTGSFGVNAMGLDFYKETTRKMGLLSASLPE